MPYSTKKLQPDLWVDVIPYIPSSKRFYMQKDQHVEEIGGKDLSVLVDDGGYYLDGFHEMMDLYVEESSIMYDNFGK